MDGREKNMWLSGILAMVTFFLVMIVPLLAYSYLDK